MNPTFQSMRDRAQAAMTNAYSMYSHFSVGACLATPDNQLFAGCNVENAAYGLTQCAEANAIGSLIASGSKKIQQALIVSSGGGFCTPCGSCRQLFAEFAAQDMQIHLLNEQGIVKTFTLAALLPEPFNLKA